MVVQGSPATFSVVATGDSLTYQWYKGTAIIGGRDVGDLHHSRHRRRRWRALSGGRHQLGRFDRQRYREVDRRSPRDPRWLSLVGGTAIVDESGILVYDTGPIGDLRRQRRRPHARESDGSPSRGTRRVQRRARMPQFARRVERMSLLTGGSVATDSAGATALFANQGANVEMYRGTISTSGTSAYGILATLGATVRVERTPHPGAVGHDCPRDGSECRHVARQRRHAQWSIGGRCLEHDQRHAARRRQADGRCAGCSAYHRCDEHLGRDVELRADDVDASRRRCWSIDPEHRWQRLHRVLLGKPSGERGVWVARRTRCLAAASWVPR
jgi:hypothetical protein